MPFWALKNLQKGKQVCRLNFNRRTRTEHYQESSDCCCSYLNQATQKNTCQVLLPKKNPGSNFFFGGGGVRFGLKTGQTLPIGYGFRGNYGSVWTYLSFLFQISKKERKYANSKWILKNLFCCCSNLSTVMIRFSVWGAYLLLVPQGRVNVHDQLTWGNFNLFLRRYLWQCHLHQYRKQKLSQCAFFNIQFDDSVERILVLYCDITVCEQLKENKPRLVHTRTLILQY